MARLFRIDQLQVPIHRKNEYLEALARTFKQPTDVFQNVEILKLSLDLRKKKRPSWTYSLQFRFDGKLRHRNLRVLRAEEKRIFPKGELHLPRRIHVVGMGPAGLWATLGLLEKGYEVVLHEQGRPVEERFRDIRHFLKAGELDTSSNVLFGEGGAGTWSDGKLTSRKNSPFTRRVLDDFVQAGADPEIRYLKKPHIGTDRLHGIVRNLRQRILDSGGEVCFGSKLEDFDTVAGCLKRIRVSGEWLDCEALVLASGHSSREIYHMLSAHGARLEAKDFALGVRVEHPQGMVNRRQYGNIDPALVGSAEYSLHCAAKDDIPGAYSFCMCPGGVLIPCATREGELATNGMSYSRRNAPFANSGVVVPVHLDALGEPLAGLAIQEELEEKAFRIGGGGWKAPAQRIGSFLEGRLDSGLPESSYPRGLVPHDHSRDFFHSRVSAALKRSFLDFDRKIPGFIEKGLLVSPETRTSSPVRVLRGDDLQCMGLRGVFPIGEGSGYSGGIVSSAADGFRLACLARTRG